jgi:4-amino-4-deoxy-L-arabinose transferase-like glycosyltransferase
MAFLRRHAPLLLVLAAASILRFHALSDLPPANYRDVALTATDALRAASGHPRLHFTYDEGLYADLMGLVFLLLGASDWTVRAPGALFGVLTCWGVLRLGRAFDRERAGLFGAALLAVSFWHVLLSRSGFRAILLPCLLVHSVACLVDGLRSGRGTWRLLLGGALFGLGVHVYPSVRFAPLFLPPYLIAQARAAGGFRVPIRRFGLFAAAAFVVASPMLLHYLRHPEHFTYPRRVLSVFSPKVPGHDVPGYLERNLAATLLMFHVHGDDNRRHNLSGAPMLDPLTGLLFLAGLVLAARAPSRPIAALLLAWVAAMLLPNILSVEGVPHGLRSCAVLPAVALLGGLALDTGFELVRQRSGARFAAAAAAVAILSIGFWTGHRYFVVWGRDPMVAHDHDAAYRQAARVLVASPPGTDLLLVANGGGFPAYGHPVEAEVYLFEMRDRPPELLGPKDTPLLVLNGRPALVAFIQRDDRIVDLIRRLNPGRTIVELHDGGVSPESPVYRVN